MRRSFKWFLWLLIVRAVVTGQDEQIKRQVGDGTDPNIDGINPGGATEFTIPNSPLYLYGEWRSTDGTTTWRDATMTKSEQLAGTIIDLKKMFPFYGGLYNYTRDAPKDMTSYDQKRACAGYRLTGERCYLQSSDDGDRFLNKIMFDLQQGIVGAAAFQADAALVVTWKNMMPNTASAYEQRKVATYQLVWATDRAGILSYAILNYDQLGFAANDVQNSAKMGRCRALLNGGNATGTVYVDPTAATKFDPRSLASLSGVPDIVRGRYLFRVDDVARRGGCSNKTQGTVPLLISPNIASILGGVSVDVNGKCWMDTATTFNLFVGERGGASCKRINAAIARCKVPVVQDWGTKEVYFQSAKNDDKAYVGFLYFVPPGNDPTSLGIGAAYEWFNNPVENEHTISWYPKNFTNPLYTDGGQTFTLNQQNQLELYRTDLELYVVGYKEATDEQMKKIVPQHRVLARLARWTNRPTLRNDQQEEVLRLASLGPDIWMISERERRETLHTYRFGYLKLAPPNDYSQSSMNYNPVASGTSTTAGVTNLRPGLTSVPIAIHWLWTLDRARYNNDDAVVARVGDMARGMCLDWYNQDGNQENFIRDTETNASCPCRAEQAKTYMTHYGQVCCYDESGYLMHTSYQPVVKTAANVPYNPGFPQRAYEFGTKPYYGQFEVPTLSSMHNDVMPYYLCCKWTKNRCQLFYWRRPSSGCQQYLPPAIGLPLKYPFARISQRDVVNVLKKAASNDAPLTHTFDSDQTFGLEMGYKFIISGRIIGAGHFITLQGRQFTFNEPGVFTLLHVPETYEHKEVNIQIRLERYPNRTVDFGRGNMAQERLVQPTAATVVTGIALQENGEDRVQVMVRKDTRRFKYRTNVVVGGVLRYFDTMWLQRYQGVLVYVNPVRGGQSEIYVILERPQIGLKIRESYGKDIKVPKGNPESSGLLDVEVSIAPDYGVISDFWRQQQYLNTQPNDVFRSIEVSGLIRPRPNQDPTSTRQEPHTAQDVQFLISEYMVANLQGGLVNTAKFQRPNLFKVETPTAVDEDVWPAKALVEKPVYAFSATEFASRDFRMVTDMALDGILRDCEQLGRQSINFGDGTDIRLNYPGQVPYVDGVKCVVGEQQVYALCGTFQPCRYDYGLLYQKEIAEDTNTAYNSFLASREDAVKHCERHILFHPVPDALSPSSVCESDNSCAAMNIEYPEYLMIQPATGPKYLDGNAIRFSCYQDHWIKGTIEYTCYKRYDASGRYWTMKWNHGDQPWCRSKARETTYKWLAAIFGMLIILGLLAGIFLCCWCVKKQRLQQSTRGRYRTGEQRPNIYTHHSPLTPPPLSRDYETTKVPVVEAEPKKMMVSLHNSGNSGTKESQIAYDVFKHPNNKTVVGKELDNQPVSRHSTLNGQLPVYDSSPSSLDRSHNSSLRGLISAV